MPYTILPALIPDIPAVYTCYFSAFASTPLVSALFPSATTSDLLDATSSFRQAHTASVISYWNTSSTQYTLKCIDTTTGDIIGMALWDVYVTPSDWKRGELNWLTGKERERAEALVMPLWEKREKFWDGRRYLYCHVTAVHPVHQKRGVGALLTEAGLRVSRETGLPVYLESSREGVGLYEKLGFRTMRESVVHRSEDLGGDGEEDVEVPLMVWVPDGGKLPENMRLKA
ncbi:hypothetical protein P154DRAFT_360662 [Amniculicola lignicola CBS 123094]|uniref:N-acetyltransferase domain-containing protein n=1 Tax=Amniculicola lignicola CBS 123094 TaxID=1392246 RepID=A0A6A5W215_9PLEO|nr:hypothetical protein P154DRAFT_360662 [Amniculicola lignicola CBS 123094]